MLKHLILLEVSMTKKLAILGASGHGKVVAEIAELCGYSVEFFDDAYPSKRTLEHWPVLGDTEALLRLVSEYSGVAVGIGNNTIRQQKFMLLLEKGINCPVLVHPLASISHYSHLALGTVVMSGATINPFVEIGKGVIINTNATIDHDCVIGDYAHVCPGVSIGGGCSVERSTWIGIGSAVKQDIKIGESSIIGAGSVVVRDIQAGVTAFGNPAKVRKV
ncbi:acetyltransferase [Pseudoalteromonas xiamenensis]|uniref:acetyltransferase n=1 Tax=Pseudoalteromonas xiamenensis TaxID=882626 RepID=UPI0027E5B2A5|nr:acetyltransferase [Pseudoalteromonas xiamenensis]WMN61170.1 acetyltransferase [Pseudoalteromonas xiamenensis]